MTVAKLEVRHSNWRLIAYGGFCLPWGLAGLPILIYLPAFYAQEQKLSAGLVGAVFVFARLWDGLFDVLIGWLSDRTQSRFGRRKPWVVIGAPFLMIATWFLCTPPLDAGLLYLGIWTFLFYTSVTFVGIPYLSWGAELSTDYLERSRITSFRETFNMIGNLFFAAGPLIFLSADAPLRDVLLLVSLTVLVLLPLSTIALASAVPDPLPQQADEKSFLMDLSVLAHDRSFLRFIAITASIWISNSIANSLVVFAFDVGLGLPGKLFLIIFILYVATLCSVPLTSWLGRRLEKHHLLAGALSVQTLGYVLLLLTTSGNFPVVAVIWVVIGFASAAVLILPASILADIIDNGEALDGQRRSGSYVAIYNLAIKIGLALGVGVAFGLAELVGYVPSAVTQSAADAFNIRLLTFGLPALLTIPAVFLLLGHPITRRRQSELRVQIEGAEAAKPIASDRCRSDGETG